MAAKAPAARARIATPIKRVEERILVDVECGALTFMEPAIFAVEREPRECLLSEESE